MSTQKSFSFQEMCVFFEMQYDRVTIYRILNDLYNGGVIERVVDIDGIHRFVYPPECFGIHPSFRCRQCGRVSQLSPLPEKYMAELSDYYVDNAVLLFSGMCQSCQKGKDMNFISPLLS